MTGVMMNQSIPYDPFSTSYLVVKDQPQPFDFSPVALYSPIQDFGTESPELQSPISPDTFSLQTAPSTGNSDNWASPFDSLSSPDVLLKTESFDESPNLDSFQPLSPSVSPAINPMDLSASQLIDDVPFGGGSGGIVGLDNCPLFPSPQLARVQNQGQVNHCAPTSRTNPVVKAEAAAATHQTTQQRPANGLKRKSISSSMSSSPRSSPSPPPPAVRKASAGSKDGHHVSLPPKKTAHNMIEKRYRNNLNDKISALRDAVPALRVMVHRLEAHQPGEAGSEEELDAAAGLGGRRVAAQDFAEDLGGLAPAHKLNKATILSKATEYIAHLERKNHALARENQGLRSKVEGMEMLMMNGATRSVWC